jgi:PTS system ascorbate-specific IIB component
MTCESAMQQLGIKCDIEHWDMGTVRSKEFDILVTTEEFKKNLEDLDNAVFVRNMVAVNSAKERLEEYLKSKNLI